MLAVDSDEFLVTPDVPAVREVAGLYADCPWNPIVLCIQLNYVSGRVTPNGPARMFRNDGRTVWTRRIHEIPTSVEDSASPDVRRPLVRIRFNHFGYDPATIDTKAKCERNLELLFRDLNDHPNDARTLFYIGREHAGLGQRDEALHYLTLAKANMSPDEEVYFRSEMQEILAYLKAAETTS